MRTILLSLVFLITAAGSAIVLAPLDFVLSKIGLGGAGIGWAQVDGTLLRGRIEGLYAREQAIGDVALNLRPMSVLSGGLEYDLQWGGAGGRGTGIIRLTPGAVEGRDLRLQQLISAVEAFDPAVRAIGGNLRLDDGAFRVQDGVCVRASGLVSTDGPSLLAQQYGRPFGLLEGPISCEAGNLVIAMTGQSTSGDTLNLGMRTSPLGQVELDVALRTTDPQLPMILSRTGFQLEDGTWRLRSRVNAGIRQ